MQRSYIWSMSDPDKQITSLTLIKCHNWQQKLRGFFLMQRGHGLLRRVHGQQLYKLMGTGKGFGLGDGVDWSCYAILQTWDDEASAKMFFRSEVFSGKVGQVFGECCTMLLKCRRSHGAWKGSNPFVESSTLDRANSLIAVITRASLRVTKLRSFWSYAAIAQRPVESAEGLRYKLGIGEHPILHMATFTIWQTLDDLNDYAYKTKEHLKAIQLTKEESWYKEELFARFQPYEMIGTWSGLDVDIPSSAY